MKSNKIDTLGLQGYFGLLKNLSMEMKLAIIEFLSAHVKKELRVKEKHEKTAFGAWQSDETAEEIIADLNASRSFSRKIEVL